VGTPVGTLPQLPTQNTFLGLPFEYTPEETALLLSRNAIVLLDAHKAARKRRSKPLKLRSSPYNIPLEFPKEWKRPGKFLHEPPVNDDDDDEDEEEEEEEEEDRNEEPESLPPRSTDENVAQIISRYIPKAQEIMVQVYEYLHDAGYWMTPGLRFGCDFNAYPGDPLRFHSHFMVHVEKDEGEVEMLTLVGGGRVATQTRKAWMLAGRVDNEIRVFSIEWAGFG